MNRRPMTGLYAAAILAMAAAAVLLAPVAGAADQPGTVGISVVDVPVARADDPRARAYIVDHVDPGSRLSRRIAVTNTTSRPLKVDLYATDAVISDGSFQSVQSQQTDGAAQWIDVDRPEVTVPAGGQETATVTIDVPEDVAHGERYAVVWAQPPPGSGDVMVVNRVGIRVYLSVGDGGEPPSDFEITSLAAGRSGGGTPTVEAVVTNTGMRALDLTGQLTLADGPGGLTAGPFSADGLTTLGINESGTMFVELDPQVPSGPWLARFEATSGEMKRSAEARITFPDGAGMTSGPVEATPMIRDRGFLLPLAVGLFLLALLLVTSVWWFKRRGLGDVVTPGG